MKQANYNIEGVLKKVLNQHPQPKSFESIWNVYKNNFSNKGREKRLVAIIVIALIALLVMGAGISRIIDNTNYPFINDPQVIGKWESVDFVQKIDDFDLDKKSTNEELYLTALAFIKNGKMLRDAEKGGLSYTTFTWTKDKVIDKQEKTASSYIIKEIDGSTYMFFEWKSGDYRFRSMKPYYYVLKKVDSNDYSNYQVAHIEDKIDYPFVDGTQMKGKWESVDFVKAIDSFKPGIKSWRDDLYLTGLNVNENGQLMITTTDGQSTSSLTWTKGMIINRGNKTASKCEVKDINGTTYMFYEWKNVDYINGGMAPWYYVLKKIK